MSNTSFYNREELLQMGFKSLGENVLISSNANFYSPETIEIGNNTRIDDFCLLTGRVIIGNYVHVSAYTSLYGKYGIELKDYSGLSPRVTIFSASDDFYGEYAVGPLLPQNITNVQFIYFDTTREQCLINDKKRNRAKSSANIIKNAELHKPERSKWQKVHTEII